MSWLGAFIVGQDRGDVVAMWSEPMNGPARCDQPAVGERVAGDGRRKSSVGASSPSRLPDPRRPVAPSMQPGDSSSSP
jgi:hypothetical protein